MSEWFKIENIDQVDYDQNDNTICVNFNSNDGGRQYVEIPIDMLARCISHFDMINEFKRLLHVYSLHADQPVDLVQWIDLDKIEANDYNPNKVAQSEMRLLYVSISHDGYTQPIVTMYDKERDKYVIVDGFHRWSIMKLNKDIFDQNGGKLPVVVIEKDINDRMASTVRHNRARGKHSVAGMSSMVFSMLDNGWSDEDICMELGMEVEELVKLKHITGFSKLFKDVNYSKAWVTKRQIQAKRKWEEEERGKTKD